MSPLGLLRSCLDYALNDATELAGLFATVRESFRQAGGRALLEMVQSVNEFRNKRVAHQDKPLTDGGEARAALKRWVESLAALWTEHARGKK